MRLNRSKLGDLETHYFKFAIFLIFSCRDFIVPDTCKTCKAAGSLFIFVVVAIAALTFSKLGKFTRTTAILFDSSKSINTTPAWLAPYSPYNCVTDSQKVSKISFFEGRTSLSTSTARYRRLVSLSNQSLLLS